MILYVRLQNTLWILMLQFHAISATMTIQNRLFFWVEPQLGQAFAIFLPVFWQPPPWAVLSQELKYIEKLCCIAFSWVSETDRDRDRGHTDFIQSMKIYRDLLSAFQDIPGCTWIQDTSDSGTAQALRCHHTHNKTKHEPCAHRSK